MLFLQMWYCDDPRLCAPCPFSLTIPPSYYHPQEFDSGLSSRGDSPMDNQRGGGKRVFKSDLRREGLFYITTPYLIMDSELRYALCVAAEAGLM